jgi:hypothetical protein
MSLTHALPPVFVNVALVAYIVAIIESNVDARVGFVVVIAFSCIFSFYALLLNRSSIAVFVSIVTASLSVSIG